MLVGSRNLDYFVLLGLHRVSHFDTINIILCGFVANQVLAHGRLSACSLTRARIECSSLPLT